MTPDPILDELHALRDRKAAALNNDLHAMADDARQRQATSGHQIVSYRSQPPRKRAVKIEAASTKRAG